MYIHLFTFAHTFARFNKTIESSSRSDVWFQLPKQTTIMPIIS